MIATATTNEPTPLLVDSETIAGMCHVSGRTVQRWVKDEGMPVVKLGRGKRKLIRFIPSDVERWIVEQQQAQTAATSEETLVQLI